MKGPVFTDALHTGFRIALGEELRALAEVVAAMFDVLDLETRERIFDVLKDRLTEAEEDRRQKRETAKLYLGLKSKRDGEQE